MTDSNYKILFTVGLMSLFAVFASVVGAQSRVSEPTVSSKPFDGSKNWEWSIVPGGYGLDSIQGLTRLTLDKNDEPYIFISQSQITSFVRYAVKEKDCWRFRFLDTDASYQLSDAAFVVDSKRKIHLALNKRRQISNSYESKLSYIFHDGNSGGKVITYSYPSNTDVAILIDKNDSPILFFNARDPLGRLLMAKRKDGTGFFEVTEVDQTAGFGFSSVSAAMDQTGRIHIIAYESSSGSAKYFVSNSNGTWAKENLKGQSGSFTKLALEQNGTPHIIFLSQKQGYREIQHAVKREIGWNFESVVKVNITQAYFAFAIDSKNRPTILHSDPNNAALYLTVKDKGTWTNEKLFDYGFADGQHPIDLAIGRDGKPRIVSVYRENIASSNVVYGVKK